jgi:hypothetical protein
VLEVHERHRNGAFAPKAVLGATAA